MWSWDTVSIKCAYVKVVWNNTREEKEEGSDFCWVGVFGWLSSDAYVSVSLLTGSYNSCAIRVLWRSAWQTVVCCSWTSQPCILCISSVCLPWAWRSLGTTSWFPHAQGNPASCAPNGDPNCIHIIRYQNDFKCWSYAVLKGSYQEMPNIKNKAWICMSRLCINDM